MKNTNLFVSERLKKGGFPQPQIQIGQVWWSKNFNQYTVIGFIKEGTAFVVRFSDALGKHIANSDFTDWTFAPTATDILAEIAANETIYLDEYPPGFSLRKFKTMWLLDMTQDGDVNTIGHNENPAEACAEAYLFISSMK
jgi:hypothetical protein